MNEREQLLETLLTQAYVEGEITLSSGRTSSWYADLRLLTMNRDASLQVGSLMAAMTEDWNYEAVGGLTMGADPVSAAILHCSNSPVSYSFSVRKQPKAHGMGKRIEGPDIRARRVLIVEDVSTTGQSAYQAVKCAEEAGAVVAGVAAILDRGGRSKFEDEKIPFRALFNEHDIMVRCKNSA